MVLQDLLVVFTVAGAVVYLFHRLRVPAVVGLLVSGVVVGPFGLSLVSDEQRVHVLAEIGIVVLLFTVGLEFSLSRVLSMGRIMARIGLPQVLLTTAATIAATWWYFGTFNQALFCGMLVTMSSTAIVLRTLIDRGELDAPHARIDVAVLLLQDLLVVVCVLVVPLMAPSPTDERSMWLSLPRGVLVMLAILLCGRFVVPGVLYQIVRTRNRELFLIAICVIVIGTATATAWAGMSLALGAFLAGLTLSESEYGHQTMAEVLPFRDTLSSLFFVSVGMLLDVRFLVQNAGLVGVSVVGLVALKFATIAVPTLAAGYPLQVAVLAGIAMAQIGEFSFVLSTTGREYGLLNAADYQTFLAAAVVTMGITPFLIQAGPRLVGAMERIPSLARCLDHPQPEPESDTQFNDHVIICGYGLNGRNLATGLRELGISYVVLEMNPETVRIKRLEGESILLGDCSRPAVLERAGIRRARSLVVGISDPVSTRQTVRVARQASPQVRTIVRTRYQSEIDDLRSLGADEIIPEEFESSIEIFARVLREYHVPGNVIRQWIERIRAGHYEAFRSEHLGREKMRMLTDQVAGQAQLENCLLAEGNAAVGHTIGQLALRSQSGATVVALRRGERVLANPGADFEFAVGDIVVLLGEPDQIDRAMALLN